ncbi:MAG: CHAT domain-containing protein [Cyanobacteria bacterium P01_F01_bin.150]
MPSIWNSSSQSLKQLSVLPGAEVEANAIAEFFGIQALIGEAATERAIQQAISSARVVHLATHGLLEYGNPKDSGRRDIPGAIALAPDEEHDGLLTSAEIRELDLNAELVVLSACDTGLGEIKGDGVIGLSRSLYPGGCAERDCLPVVGTRCANG